jgi:hypothetical protein
MYNKTKNKHNGKPGSLRPEGLLRLNLALPLVSLILLATVAKATQSWRVLPIRSQEEYNQGLVGGEAMQHLHGICRSESDPNYIYWSHDMGGPWISVVAGKAWKKCVAKGLYQSNGN